MGQKGYDAGKNISGIKRHIAVDSKDYRMLLRVTTAEATDRKGALLAGDGTVQSDLAQVQRVLADGGY